MLWNLHMMRYLQYVDILEHLFNTGQGVVTERSPFSDWAYIDAAFNQGWIDKTTKTHYWKVILNITTTALMNVFHFPSKTQVFPVTMHSHSVE